ncbi:MAG: hypothetical protein RJA29_883 [Pseudomonadota bacterium]
MAHIGRHVDRTAFAAQHVQVLRKGLEIPFNALTQHIQRHALHLREITHGDVAVGGLAGGDGEATIADDCRGDTQRRRRAHTGVPGNLGIKVGVAVDDAGHEGQARAIDHLPGLQGELRSHGADAALAHGQITDHRVGA